jgi:hypothetical protein
MEAWMSVRWNLSAGLAVLAALSLIGARAQWLSRDPSSLAEVRISSKPGLAVPNGFMGLSHEWGNTMSMFGYSTTGANLAYRQLLTNLTAYGSDPIELRIGGNSTDTTGKPSGDRMKPYAELSTALHSRFILGVNLGAGDLALTQNQVEFYLNQMPKGAIEAIEIGNEPDHYPKRKMRPEPYGIGEYLQDFDTWKHGVLPLLPKGTFLAGPSWSALEMIPNSGIFLSREAGSVSVLSLHYYAGSPYSNPPPDYLLKPRAATSGPAVFAPAVAAAHDHHIPIRITELNSFFGVGVHGSSDAFSAALWSIDTMFEYVNAGVDGVNWEADGGNFCSPFIFTRTTSGQRNTFTLKTATPLYYGLLFFQAATGKGARLLPVEVDTRANLKAWATVDEAGQTRLAIINKDEAAQGNVHLQMPGYRQATILRLVAPSFTSLSGVTFGGRTLDGSADGRLVGAETIETVHATGGRFEIPMPVTSAAILTFSK